MLVPVAAPLATPQTPRRPHGKSHTDVEEASDSTPGVSPEVVLCSSSSSPPSIMPFRAEESKFELSPRGTRHDSSHSHRHARRARRSYAIFEQVFAPRCTFAATNSVDSFRCEVPEVSGEQTARQHRIRRELVFTDSVDETEHRVRLHKDSTSSRPVVEKLSSMKGQGMHTAEQRYFEDYLEQFRCRYGLPQ